MLKKIVLICMTCCVILLVWQGIYFFYGKELFTLPSPLHVVEKLIRHYDRFAWHAYNTFLEMIGGMFFAALIAFPLAWAMYVYPSIRTTSQFLFLLTQCLPMFALAPIMVTCFGWSYMAILIPTTLMLIFPLTTNVYRGVSQVPQEYIDFFRMHGAREWQILLKLRIPYALPHIFSGLRIASAVSGVGAIAGEFAGAQVGLGVYIQECRRNFDIEGIFAGLFCLAALTLSFYGVMAAIEKLCSRGAHDEAKIC